MPAAGLIVRVVGEGAVRWVHLCVDGQAAGTVLPVVRPSCAWSRLVRPAADAVAVFEIAKLPLDDERAIQEPLPGWTFGDHGNSGHGNSSRQSEKRATDRIHGRFRSGGAPAAARTRFPRQGALARLLQS